jgi:hypothetical protein
MIKSALDDSKEAALELPSEKPIWQAPKLEKLKLDDIGGGFTNVPESDSGVLYAGS